MSMISTCWRYKTNNTPSLHDLECLMPMPSNAKANERGDYKSIFLSPKDIFEGLFEETKKNTF